MFELSAGKTRLSVRAREPLTSGSAGVYRVRVAFSPEWAGFVQRTAVFRAGDQRRSVPLDSADSCTIPRETLETAGVHLFAGVRGTDGQGNVLPTVWADLGMIQEGTGPGPGETVQPPAPGTEEPLQYQFGHGLKVTGDTVSVDAVDGFSGDNTLPITAAAVQRTVGNIEVLLETI